RARCATCGGPHGRPVLGGSRALDALHASVAHAGDAVVVAVSGHGPIGIDAEPSDREVPSGMSLARWVRIEAVLKADGRGLLVDPALVRFEDDATGAIAWIDGDGGHYRVVDVALEEGLMAAVARLHAGPSALTSVVVVQLSSGGVPAHVDDPEITRSRPDRSRTR
uniref:4'-phosphopantetheinyl transferase family protein n=1 Tax=Clavibacter sp. MX14-G9D TaxID=3064656 RepID=UPI00293E24A3